MAQFLWSSFPFHHLLLLSSLIFGARAHMMMDSPYPIRSQNDPAVPSADKDYSYTSPLLADGSNFPCKGYQNGPGSTVTKATYVAGGTYSMTLKGTATHGGGSCQLSLSYDNGKSFKVIQSIIGGCPIDPSYSFTIPSFSPPSQSVLLAWSWFNLVGNREMYMNCARVEIKSASSRQRRWFPFLTERQTSMDELPDMMACNVANGCNTIEGQEVNFPFPGSNVIYGQDWSKPAEGSGFAGTDFAGDNAPNGTFNGTTTSDNFNPSTFKTSSTYIALADLTSTNFDEASYAQTVTTFTEHGTVTSATVEGSASFFPTNTTSNTLATPSGVSAQSISIPTTTFLTFPASASSPITSSHTETGPPTECTPGTFFCNTPTTFSTCISLTSPSGTTFLYMGSVAAGMTCVDGKIIRENDGTCTLNGQITCDGPNAISMCDNGGLIEIGPVAPGTECLDGKISRMRT